MWMGVHGTLVSAKPDTKTCKFMGVINNDGSLQDTGTGQESEGRQGTESPAHQRNSFPPTGDPGFLTGTIGWNTLWKKNPQVIARTTATFLSGVSIIAVADATYISNGNAVHGSGIPSGTTVTGVTGTTINISHNTTSGSSGNYDFVGTLYSGNIVPYYPTTYDAAMTLFELWTNYDDPSFTLEMPNGNATGTNDLDGFAIFEPHSYPVFTATAGAITWGNSGTPSTVGEPYTFFDFVGVGSPYSGIVYQSGGFTSNQNGTPDSYLFNFSSTVVSIIGKQWFAPGTYFQTTGLRTSSSNSDFAAVMTIGPLTINFSAASGITCATAGVIANNTNIGGNSWQADFSFTFLYPFQINFPSFGPMGYDGSDKTTAAGQVSVTMHP